MSPGTVRAKRLPNVRLVYHLEWLYCHQDKWNSPSLDLSLSCFLPLAPSCLCQCCSKEDLQSLCLPSLLPGPIDRVTTTLFRPTSVARAFTALTRFKRIRELFQEKWSAGIKSHSSFPTGLVEVPTEKAVGTSWVLGLYCELPGGTRGGGTEHQRTV